ncbi:Fructokinase, partial [hydrothermal vent metagenome]
EVLFDIFPDENEVLGGAPFNVAWNLKGFGLDPLFISRVGSDKRGERVLESMRKFGMSTTSVQIDNDRPTGVVKVRMDNSGHTFDILPDQAYDYIETGSVINALENTDSALLYHGTLSIRSAVSSKTLDTLLDTIKPHVFVDVNLRAPWCDGASAKKALEKARWAKLNNEELGQTLGSCAIKEQDIEMMSEYLRSEAGLDILVVTLGEKGALLAAPDRIINSNPAPVNKIVDTVGAGDAFCSVVILGVVYGWTLDVIMDRAITFASDVCQIRGATSSDTDFYQRRIKKWKVA